MDKIKMLLGKVVCVGGRAGAREEWQSAECHRRRCLIATEQLLNIE